jgi:hypothetical protein
MKKLKSVTLVIVLLVVLHITTVLALSNAKIFPCQISSIGGNMQTSEWRNGMCDVNYKHWIGSVQKLTIGANIERISLIYGLPVLLTGVIMYGLHFRKRRIDMMK